MKKNKGNSIKKYKIYLDLWKEDLIILVCDHVSYEKYIKEKFKINDFELNKYHYGESLDIGCKERGLRKSIIWMREFDRGDAGYMYLLIHEVIHITHNILSHKGMKLCDETTEVYAFTAEYIFRECWRKLAAK